jgi:hypothetical protein
MDAQARGEVDDRIVLHDEDDQAFACRPLRVLRDGPQLFLITELEGAGSLHVLAREDRRFVVICSDADRAGLGGGR